MLTRRDLVVPLLACLLLGCNRTPPAPPPPVHPSANGQSQPSLRSLAFGELVTEYETAVARYQLLPKDTESPRTTFPARFLEFAKKEDDAASLEACEYIVLNFYFAPELDAAYDLVIQHHLNKPEVGRFLANMVYKEDGYEAVDECLQKAVTSSNPQTQAHAKYQQARLMIDRRDWCLSGGSDRYDGVFDEQRIASFHSETTRQEIATRLQEVVSKSAGANLLGRPLADWAKQDLFEIQHLEVGRPAPDIQGRDSNGQSFGISDYRGKVVVVTFWAHWCGGCMAHLPEENKFVAKMKGRPMVWLGVNGDEDVELLQTAERENKVNFRSWHDGKDGPIADRFAVRGWPAMYVIDHDGIIRHKARICVELEKDLPVIESLVATVESAAACIKRAGRGSPDPALDSTAGLPNSEGESKKTNEANGDLPSKPAAGSGDPRRAQESTRTNPRDATRLLTKRLSADPKTRTLELIYVLRQYRVFSRDEEWAQAIRELAKIGQPAMFELIEELDRTDRDSTLRSLGNALRAMNDPRAVPALIRAIPKTLRPGGSDCGTHLRDPDLTAFMQAHDLHPDKDGGINIGRPVNEILDALERLTGHHWPEGDEDPLRHIFLDPPETRVEQLKPFLERQAHWQEWWAEHGQEFLTAAELRALEQPAKPQAIGEDGFDKVDRAGVARFGQLFPTGVDVRLGPVHDVELFLQDYADAPTVLDFDGHQTWRFFEAALDRSESFPDWIHRTGADVHCGANLQEYDTRVWVIDNSRWDTIDREVAQPGPLKLGVEPRGGMRMLQPDQKTLLFTTREGGSGILRLDPYNRQMGSRGIRYRMWPTERRAMDAPPPAAPKVEVSGVWEAAVKVSLQSPGADKKCAWSLPGKRSLALASDISLENLNQRFWRNDEEFETWKRDNKITFFTVPTERENEEVLGGAAGGAQEELALFVFGCLSREVRPQAFTDLTVAMAIQILSKSHETELRNTELFSRNLYGPQPQTRLFLLADGTIGLLQITKADTKQDVLEFQYKLARIHPDKADNAKGDLRSNPAAGSGDPRRAQNNPAQPNKSITYKCRVITSGTKAPITGATVVFTRMVMGDPRYRNERRHLIEKTTHVTDDRHIL